MFSQFVGSGGAQHCRCGCCRCRCCRQGVGARVLMSRAQAPETLVPRYRPGSSALARQRLEGGTRHEHRNAQRINGQHREDRRRQPPTVGGHDDNGGRIGRLRGDRQGERRGPGAEHPAGPAPKPQQQRQRLELHHLPITRAAGQQDRSDVPWVRVRTIPDRSARRGSPRWPSGPASGRAGLSPAVGAFPGWPGSAISSTHRSSPSSVAATSSWACRPRGSRSCDACKTRRMSCAAGASAFSCAPTVDCVGARPIVARVGGRAAPDGRRPLRQGGPPSGERTLLSDSDPARKGLGATPVSAACPESRVRRGRRTTCIVSARRCRTEARLRCRGSCVRSGRPVQLPVRGRRTSRFRSAGRRRR